MAEWYLKDGVFGPHDSPAPPDDVVRTTAQAAITISDSTAAGRALLTAATAAAQRTALALATVANTGAYSDLTGVPAAGGSPGGSSGQIQYNNAGAFGGDAGLTFNSTTKAIGFSGQLLPSIGYSPSAPAYSSAGSPTSGMTFSSGGAYFSSGGVSVVSFNNTGFVLRNNMPFGWTSGNADAGANDTAFSRLAANKVGLGNGTLADVSGTLVLAKVEAVTLKLSVFTVATLPAAPSVNDVCSVNNALSPTWRGIVAAGGAQLVDVKWNGTDWICTG